jgi:hypothetical protein
MIETPLQPVIESFERTRAAVQNEDIIKGIDFALEIVRAYEKVVEQKLNSARLEGADEALKQLNEKLSK